MAGNVSTHWLSVELQDGHFSARVMCPDEPLGAARPCAVWATDDGSERENECTFQQYAENCDLEDWLHGSALMSPVPIVEVSSSFDDWHAEVKKES